MEADNTFDIDNIEISIERIDNEDGNRNINQLCEDLGNDLEAHEERRNEFDRNRTSETEDVLYQRNESGAGTRHNAAHAALGAESGSTLTEAELGAESRNTPTQAELEFIDRFKPEFLREVADHLMPSDILDHLQLHDDVKDKIRRAERRQGCDMLLEEIGKEAKRNPSILQMFIYALEREDYKRLVRKFECACTTRDDNFKQEYLRFLFVDMKPDLMDQINPTQLVAYLRRQDLVKQLDFENINNLAIRDRREACRELFSLLQRKNDDWEAIVYEGLRETQPNIVSKMDPAPDNDDLQRKNIRTQQGQTEVQTSTQPREPGYDSDYEVDEKDETSESEKEQRRRAKPTLQLRKYQLELAELAKQGHNTIICAETGTGKTWVALHITQHHLQQDRQGRGLVVFLARTNALVKQQFKIFELYLSNFKVVHLRTETKECLAMHMMMDKADVFFMTPQILQNNLNLGKVKVTDISLMIFDECHHARKKEPYNMLMKKYHAAKMTTGDESLPQIVGLTATLGIGGSSTEEGAMEHMIKLCANLNVVEISRVQNNLEEFKQHVHQAKHETIKMGAKEKDPCKLKLTEAMNVIEKEIESLGVQNRREFKVFWSKKPDRKNGPTYQKWANRFKNKAACKIKDDQKLARMVNSAMDHIAAYNEALDINYLMDIQNVIDYLFERFSSELDNNDKLIGFEERLLNLLKGLRGDLENTKPWPENPYLKLLRQTLVDLKETEEEPRGLVFVKTRATAFSLAEYLNEDLSGLGYRVEPFTGTSFSNTSRGMQESTKSETLQKFRDGDINLLVATSVGSEGIDVPECNFIVTYNFTGNETTISQMSGRARRQGSKAYHVSDYGVQQKEEMSLQRVIIMKKAFKRLSSKPVEEIKDKVKQYQLEDLMRNAEYIRILPELQKVSFTLICYKCHSEVAAGCDVRLYTNQHRVVMAEDFRERARYEELEIQSKFTQSEIKCANCKLKWGTTFKIEQIEVPVLKITAVLFKLPNISDNLKYKKWGKVPYYIEPIQKAEMLQTFRDLLKRQATGN